MFATLIHWLDHRTGYRKLVEALLIEHIPGGAKWRYVWGSCLAFVFSVQLITGVLLMTAYSAGESTAWSSVYFIQYEMDFGWLIRGVHHFGSQAMVVLLGLHMLQVVIAGAHLPPREVNWWLGLALLAAVLGLSLTGYLLPWDQKGFWATQVATNIAGNLPVAGPLQQKIIVGGPEYGHHTLTRFYTLHVGILPPLVIVLIIAHLAVFRRHGVTTPKNAAGSGWFWPEQAFRDMVVSLLIFAALLVLVLWGHSHAIGQPSDAGLYERMAHAGRAGHGANLDAPADPGTESYPARPEWYFLFLFQLLKYFEGDQEIIGTVVVPMAAGLLLVLLPLLGYGWMRRCGHVFGVVVVVGLLTGVAALTLLAFADDMVCPPARTLIEKTALGAVPILGLVFLLHIGVLSLLSRGRFRQVVSGAGVVVLAGLVFGTAALAYTAMKTENRYLEYKRVLAEYVTGHPELKDRVSGYDQDPFAGYVAYLDSQMPFLPENGHTVADSIATRFYHRMTAEERKPSKNAEKFQEELVKAGEAAARAVRLASAGVPEEGARYLLRRDPLTVGRQLFGQHCAVCHTHGEEFKNDKATASDLAGFGTKEWVRGLLQEPDSPHYFGRTNLKEMSGWVRRERARAKKDKGETELAADFDRIADWLAGHPREEIPKEADASAFAQGYRAFEQRCSECHTYKAAAGEAGKAPDFTGYGDADWVRMMIMAPYHPFRYGTRNTMPAFRDLEGPTAEITRQELHQLKEFLAEQAGGEGAEADKKKKQIAEATKLIHLSDIDRELIIRWLLKDYRVVFGGEPIAGPPKR